jgi:hypothetical protein
VERPTAGGARNDRTATSATEHARDTILHARMQRCIVDECEVRASRLHDATAAAGAAHMEETDERGALIRSHRAEQHSVTVRYSLMYDDVMSLTMARMCARASTRSRTPRGILALALARRVALALAARSAQTRNLRAFLSSVYSHLLTIDI